MDHLSAALAGSQHCTQPDCMGNEGRDGGMKEGREEKKDERCREGVKKKRKYIYIYKPKKRVTRLRGKKQRQHF